MNSIELRLNFQHLYYFWMIAREGGVSRAAIKLRLAQPTLSAQLHTFEDAIGTQLFRRVGRTLELTDMGQVAYRYADTIFKTGHELVEALADKKLGSPILFSVGIVDVLPKMVAYRILEPALQIDGAIRLVCKEDRPEKLLSELALSELDLVLSDIPIPSSIRVKAYSHLLGESPMAIFGTKELVSKYKQNFPYSLHQAPMLIPSNVAAIRKSLEDWFEQLHIQPKIIAEFEDSALMKIFGQAGKGLFPASFVTKKDILRQYDVDYLGTAENVRERVYAISTERRLRHPAVVAITKLAKETLFSPNTGM